MTYMYLYNIYVSLSLSLSLHTLYNVVRAILNGLKFHVSINYFLYSLKLTFSKTCGRGAISEIALLISCNHFSLSLLSIAIF